LSRGISPSVFTKGLAERGSFFCGWVLSCADDRFNIDNSPRRMTLNHPLSLYSKVLMRGVYPYCLSQREKEKAAYLSILIFSKVCIKKINTLGSVVDEIIRKHLVDGRGLIR